MRTERDQPYSNGFVIADRQVFPEGDPLCRTDRCAGLRARLELVGPPAGSDWHEPDRRYSWPPLARFTSSGLSAPGDEPDERHQHESRVRDAL